MPAMTSRWFQCRWPLKTARTRPLCSNAARSSARSFTSAMWGRPGHQRESSTSCSLAEWCMSTMVGDRVAAEILAQPVQLRVVHADVDVLPLEGVQDHEVPAGAIERVVERAGALPEARQILPVHVDEVVVAGHVHELGLRGRAGWPGTRRSAQIGLARLVLDVVAEVHDQVGLHLVVHLADEVARQLAGQVGELAQLAVPAGLGSEVDVGDEAQRERLREGARGGRRVRRVACHGPMILVLHAAHRHRSRSRQPARSQHRRDPQDARPRDGQAHARVDPRRAGRSRVHPQGRHLHLRLQGRGRPGPLPRVHVRAEHGVGAQQHPGVAALRARAPGRRLRVDLRRHRVPRLGGEEGRRLAARQGAGQRHRLAPPLHLPHPAPRDRRREDARRGRPHRRAVAQASTATRPAASSSA